MKMKKMALLLGVGLLSAATVGCIKKKKDKQPAQVEAQDDGVKKITEAELQKLISEAVEVQLKSRVEAELAARKAVKPATAEEKAAVESTIEKLNVDAASLNDVMGKLASFSVGVPEQDLPLVYDAFVGALAKNADYVMPIIDGYYHIKELGIRSTMKADQYSSLNLSEATFAVMFADELYRKAPRIHMDNINYISLQTAKAIDTSASYYNSATSYLQGVASTVGTASSEAYNIASTTVSSYWSSYWDFFARQYGLK
jgi:hypothetical protein